MSTRLLAVLALLGAVSLSACGGGDDSTATDASGSGSPSATSSSTYSAPADDGRGPCSYPTDTTGTVVGPKVVKPPSHPVETGTVMATIDTTIGTFTFSLDAKTAPCTVNSFVALAEQGYYDNAPCHRLTVLTGFEVLQCGDPSGTGRGGPGYTIPDELTGTETYPAGTLAMANTGQPDTGGSQFFICYGDTRLPPSYTVFGTADQATIAAIKKIEADGTDNANGQGDGHPNTAVTFRTVTIG